MKTGHISIVVFALMLIFVIGGCRVASLKTTGGTVLESEFNYDEGNGDAFLYDVKIYRDGRKNSVRLDVYRMNDRLGIFARGYLGKGVLKGVVTPDSVVIYFPTENEYYSGKLNDLIDKSCAVRDNLERLVIDLFVKRPVELDYPADDFYVTVIEEKNREKKYRLESKNCAESALLEYDYKSDRFLLEKIDFTNRDNTFRFRAERRREKLNVGIPAEKLSVAVPSDAVRINL